MTPHLINEEQLAKEYREGKSVLYLANQFGCSTSAISRRLKKLGIKARPFSTKGLQTRLGAVLSEETKEKIRKGHIGKKLSPEHRAKVVKTLALYREGEKNPNWQGGLTKKHRKENNRLRKTVTMRLWRQAVFERDGYRCVWCGRKDNLHADHIQRFSVFPELRDSISNGRTLCASCHRKTDTYGNKKASKQS